MKIVITPNTPAAALRSFLTTYPLATHIRCERAGAKRAKIIERSAMEKELAGQEVAVTVEFGTRDAPGLPFIPEDAILAVVGASETELPDAPPPDAPPPPPTKKTGARMEEIQTLQRARSQAKTYIAYMDALLLDLALDEHGQPIEAEGFLRSKHSIHDAVKLVLKKYGDKDPASVKRILKVRPRHMEKMKTLGLFDDAKTALRAPRWAWVGPGSGVDFVRRIRQLLTESNRTPDVAAEIAAKEFSRDPKDALRIAKNTAKHIKATTGHGGPNKAEKKAAKQSARAALIAKNKALRAKAKSAAR